MLNLINDRLNRKVFDDVMEVAWSTMWNVTDETAVNCERFLDGKGMEFFLGCLKVRFSFEIKKNSKFLNTSSVKKQSRIELLNFLIKT